MAFGNIFLTIMYVLLMFYTIFWLLTLLELKGPSIKKLMRYPTVSVLIPAYNEEKYLKECADSVLRLDYPKDKIQIIIMDDGSTDNTPSISQAIKNENPNRDITLITIPNQGKSRALNEGLKAVRGEFFASLDADSFVPEKTLKNLLSYFTDKSIAVVLPWIKVHNPKSFFQRVQWYEYLVSMFSKKLFSLLNCVHVAPGPFSVYRTHVVREIGGFRRAHFTEDLEIALRLQERQYKILQVEESVYTLAPKGINDILRQRKRWLRGCLLNLWTYRKMFFKSRYGDFGVFHMPVILLHGFIAVALVSITLYLNILQPLWSNLTRLFLIDFDVFTLFSNMSFRFVIFDLNFYNIFIIISFSLLSFFVVWIAHRFARENLMKQGIKSIAFFLLFYYLTLIAVFFSLLTDLFLRRENKW